MVLRVLFKTKSQKMTSDKAKKVDVAKSVDIVDIQPTSYTDKCII